MTEILFVLVVLLQGAICYRLYFPKQSKKEVAFKIEGRDLIERAKDHRNLSSRIQQPRPTK